MLKKYEIMTIASLDLGEDGAKSLFSKIKDLVKTFKGNVVEEESKYMGKRKFAYDINHKKEGFYDVLVVNVDSLSMPKMREKLNYTDGIVRYLVTQA